MDTLNLRVEYLIIGAVSLLTVSFIFLLTFGVYQFNFYNEIKSLTTGETILLTIVTYILGSIVNRLLSLINYPFAKRIIKNIILKFILSNKDVWHILNYDGEKEAFKYYYLFQYGSEAVIERLKFHESILSVQKSLVFLLPLTAIFGTIWLSYSYPIKHQLIFSSSFLLLAFMAFKTHRLVKYSQFNLIHGVYEILKGTEKNES